MAIFCLAEQLVHINDYKIERDAQVIWSDLFYSFALAHSFVIGLICVFKIKNYYLKIFLKIYLSEKCVEICKILFKN